MAVEKVAVYAEERKQDIEDDEDDAVGEWYSCHGVFDAAPLDALLLSDLPDHYAW